MGKRGTIACASGTVKKSRIVRVTWESGRGEPSRLRGWLWSSQFDPGELDEKEVRWER